MTEGYLWGAAQVTYPDWVGTAQLDEKLTEPTIRDAIDLDQDEWVIIGLDIGGGEHSHSLRVVAVHRDLIDDGGTSWAAVAAANNGEIPATEFLIHDVDPYDVLKAITHVFEMRLRVAGIRDYRIRIMSQSDVPEQSMGPP